MFEKHGTGKLKVMFKKWGNYLRKRNEIKPLDVPMKTLMRVKILQKAPASLVELKLKSPV